MNETKYFSRKPEIAIKQTTGIKDETNLPENNIIETYQYLTEDLNDNSFQQFKKESEEEIIECEKRISAFKALSYEDNHEHEVRSVWLDYKISDLKMLLNDYTESGQEHWKSFKIKFNHELDELEKVLKHFSFKKADN